MRYTDEQLNKIEALAEDLRWEWGCVGIRCQEVPFALGRMDHTSHRWDNNEDTGEELDGVSAQAVHTLRTDRLDYPGDHVALIVGDRDSYGDDPGELVIEDAQVAVILA